MSADWGFYRLEDVGELVTGKTPSSKIINAFGLTGYPFVTPRDMDGRRWVDTTERYLTEEGMFSVKSSLVPENSVAVSCIGSDMGKAALLKTSSVTNQQINTIIVNEEFFSSKFIYYVLSTKQQEFKNIAGGSATPILNKGHFGQYEIPIPDKVTQERIVKYLDSFDNKIELNRQTNQTLEQIAQAIFKSWFVDFEPTRAKIIAKEQGASPATQELAAQAIICGAITLEQLEELEQNLEATLQQIIDEKLTQDNQTPINAEQLKATAALFPNELVESELGEVPKDWRSGTIGDVASVQGGYAFKGKSFVEKGNPVVKIKNITGDGRVDLTGSDCIDNEQAVLSERFKLKNGDLLMAMTGATVGKIGLVVTEGKLVYLNQRVARFESKKFGEKISWFLFCCFKRDSIFESVVGAAQGSAQPNISATGIESIRLVIADDELIDLFCQKTDALFQAWLASTRANKELEELRDTLLPKLLSGELAVPDSPTPAIKAKEA